MAVATVDPLASEPDLRSPSYSRTVWTRFRRDPVAVAAGIVVLALILMAAFCTVDSSGRSLQRHVAAPLEARWYARLSTRHG